MHKLKKNVTRTWDLLNEGNFSVSKSDVPFTAIGPDHGIEQENLAPKYQEASKELAIHIKRWMSTF